MTFFISVRCKGETLFEIYSRAGGLSLAEAWAAALPALMTEPPVSSGNQIILRINNEPVLDR